MAKIDEGNIRLDEIITGQFQERIQRNSNNVYGEVAQEESRKIDLVFDRNYDEMCECIMYYLKCTPNEAMKVIDENMETARRNVKNRVNEGRQNSKEALDLETFYTVNNEKHRNVERVLGGMDKEESINQTINSICSRVQDLGDNEDIKKVDASVKYRIEDELSTGLKADIKRKLNVYDDKNGENAFYEISRMIDNNLVQRIEDIYDENSHNIVSKYKMLVEEVAQDIKQDYTNELRKQKEQKGEAENARANGFSDLLKENVKDDSEYLKESENTEENKTYRQSLEDKFI